MGAWTEIVDYTVPSSTTSFTVNNFGTITKNDFIKVVATFTAVSSFVDVNMTANSSSITDYTTQYLMGQDTSVTAVRSNRAAIHLGNTGTDFTGNTIGYLKISENDRANMLFNDLRRNNTGSNSAAVNFLYSTSHNATFSSGITSLTFSAANSIKAGSRIQIYRLDAEKVADITTTSNATQVDISSLSIGKDSEYLLVIDADSGNIDGRLMVNDNTTVTNYYRQLIQGFGSTASASRANTADVMFSNNNTRSMAYIHIKLSEIGAYTAQSYSLRDYGTTTPQLLNFFVSSTAENITSITKLNFVSVTSNSIKSGSRFILYKLK